MVRRTGVLVLFLAMTIALAGCTDKNGSGKDPELVAQEAIKSFGGSVSSQDGGDIKRLTGSFTMHPSTGDSDFEMFASGSFDMTFEWGKNDVVYILFGMKNGGMTMNVEVWCSETQNVVKWGDQVYGGRAGATAIHDGDSMCDGSEDMDQMKNGLDLFSSEEFAGLEITDLETHSDGSMTVSYKDPAENGTLTAKIDKKGRITQMDMTSDEGSGTFHIAYGTRDTITVPETTARVPAKVDWRLEVASDGTHTATIYSSEAPPLDEITARIVIQDWSDGSEEVRASFPLHAKGEQTSAGYRFTYTDVDADGRVSENDTMSFMHPDWQESGMTEETLVLYDEWAGANVNENPVPALGIVPLLGVTALAIALLRRRH